jgi:predicted MFS family arabinose efflux permease
LAPNIDSAALGGARTGAGTWYAVALLTAIYTLNFLDRQIVSILAAPIIKDLELSNTEFALISGLAFAVLYSVLGIPLAWLADRFNRVQILSAACLLWSGMTALCGQATGFKSLFLFRVGVGVGEAACVPASHSLIADMTQGRSRALALAVFALGIPLGTLAGLWIGGSVAQAHGWRTAFLVVGLPGVALALLLLLTVREPRRQAAALARSPARGQAGSPMELLRLRPYRQLTLGAAFAAMGGYGVIAFLGLYLVKHFGMNLAQVGFGLGLAIGVGGVIGTALGGRTGVWTGSARGARIAAGLALILAGGALAAGLLAGNATQCLIAFGFVAGLNALWYGPVFSDVQTLAPPQSRAMAAAVLNMVVNLVGLGLGPLMVGGVSDLVVRLGLISDPIDALRAGLMTMAVSNTLAALFLIRARTSDPSRQSLQA